MPDLDDRFASLEGVRAPDVWPDVTTREPRRMIRRRSRGSAVAALVAFAVVAASIAWLAVALGGRSRHGPGPAASATPSPPATAASPIPASVSGLSTNGSVRCTASVASVAVDPGQTVIVRFTVENLSDSEQQIGDVTQVLVDDAAGRQVYDSFLAQEPRYGGIQTAEHLAPGERFDLLSAKVPIQWAGPLTLHPVCPVPQGDPAGNLPLASLGLQVANPGPVPDPGAAVSTVLDAFEPLFANCRPVLGAGPVVGEVGPLPGIDAPALDARCGASVDREPGFDVVTITFVSPSDAAVPEIPDPVYGVLAELPSLPEPVEVWRAMAVVTIDGPFVVESPEYGFTADGSRDIDVAFEDGRWAVEGRGGDTCSTGRVSGFGGGVVFFQPVDCPNTGQSGPASSGPAG